MNDITTRKDEHVRIVLEDDVRARRVTTGLETIQFRHDPLPELALTDVDVSTTFLGYDLAAPLLISSMTGGPARSEAINRHIAVAAQHLRIPFGVGSQRIALEQQGASGLGPDLRKAAPGVPILANLGAAQLRTANGIDLARRAIDMIGADAIIIHLNAVQEAVQEGGDTDWRGVLEALDRLVRASPVPVIAKEVGFGISGEAAIRLQSVGVGIVDVAGAGGTSWAAVEAARSRSLVARAVAEAFRDWGIPTAEAITMVRQACPAACVIASGGIRDGIDAARAIRLGADLVGQAGPTLQAAIDGPEALIAHFEAVIAQLRIVCFATGSPNLAALGKAALI
ncbi:MAG: hypothetical protein RLZ98_1857 [Pseudomonadota bacterium]|jgi:isopentenyl-diphosphate delta-isomerase